MPQIIYITWDGGYPFMVKHDKSNVNVYRQKTWSYPPQESNYDTRPILKLKNVKRVRVTRRPKDCTRNILIELPQNKYILGWRDFIEFKTDEPITGFHSNDNYPFAVSRNWVYFPAEKAKIAKKDFPKDKRFSWASPYKLRYLNPYNIYYKYAIESPKDKKFVKPLRTRIRVKYKQ